jgi:dihydroorotate dehydrogenase
MVFQNPGLEALHQYITGEQKSAAPIEQNVTAEAEKKAEIEEITKEVQEDARIERPVWKGFGQ